MFVLTKFERPSVQVISIKDHIIMWTENETLVCDKRHSTDTPGVFKMCQLQMNARDKAIILGTSLVYVHNDHNETLVLETDPLFPPTDDKHNSGHPDFTGKVTICIPGDKWAGEVPARDQEIYKPNMYSLGIKVLQYAGMEAQILGARSTCLRPYGIQEEYEAFALTDAIAVYLLENKHLFKGLRSDDMMSYGDAGIVLIKQTLVDVAKEHFRNIILPLLHYTTIPHITLKPKGKLPPIGGGFVTMCVQLDYCVISPSILSFKEKTIKF